jgi:tetratricopeptide (TPR) repeat protein
MASSSHAAYAARITGRAYMALGNAQGARDAFNRALAVAPDDGPLWTDIARFRRGTGDLAGAIEAADRAVRINPRTVEALVLRGELTRTQYGLAASLPWFDRALEIDRNNLPALLDRAATNGDLGRMTAMLADARQAHMISGGNPTAFYLEAVLAARARNYPLARSLYDRTSGAFDSAPAGMLLASTIDIGLGNFEQAADRLADLVERQPSNAKARKLLAMAQWRQGDAQATIATLRPLADRPDADSYTLTLMGQALGRTGDAVQASRYLARAARPQSQVPPTLDPLSDEDFARARAAADGNPADGPSQVRLVSALLARGLGGEALERARALTRLSPGAPEAWLLLGDALGERGDFAGAADQYRRAANLSFTETVAMRLIEALQRSGRTSEADAVLGLFLRQNPQNIPALVLRAGRLMQANDWQGAIGVYENLRARIGNNDATVLNNLAWAYGETGDYARAIPLARRAWSLDRDNPTTADTLGWILFKSGASRAEGLALLERAARGAPSDASIQSRLDQARRNRS